MFAEVAVPAGLTWNPADKDPDITLSNGNLTASASSGTFGNSVRATAGKSAGKWYWELVSAQTEHVYFGVALSTHELNTDIGQSANSWSMLDDGRKYHNASAASYGSDPGANAVIGIALDMDAGKIWWAINNSWQASGDPGAGTNAAYSNVTGTVYPAVTVIDGKAVTARFAAAAQSYTPPSEFSAIG
jgi:SPRY domain